MISSSAVTIENTLIFLKTDTERTNILELSRAARSDFVEATFGGSVKLLSMVKALVEFCDIRQAWESRYGCPPGASFDGLSRKYFGFSMLSGVLVERRGVEAETSVSVSMFALRLMAAALLSRD